MEGQGVKPEKTDTKPRTLFEIVARFLGFKKDPESRESYMKVYEKQSTEKAVRGTQLILQYVASKGIAVSPEIINTITASKEIVESNKKLNSKEEADFWVSYTELSKLIQPVTVKSLKCIREEFGVYSGFVKKKKISYAERVQGFYRKTGIAVLLIVLATQVLWLWQNYILKESNETSNKLKASYQTLHTIKKDGLKDTQKKYQAEIDVLELNQKLKIQKKNLEKYTSPLQMVCYPFRVFGLPCGIKEKFEATPSSNTNPVNEEILDYKEMFDEAYLNHIQELTFSVEILTLYLLPLAYGLLGSCTYILRVIALEIEKQIYVREHDIQYALRILLGTFAGFVIGWFISSDADINGGFSPAKLSPFAIAFLAGYSVELLFTMLDKIVSVYSGTAKKQEDPEHKE